MSEALAVDTGEGTPLNLSIVASKDDDGKDDDISHLASLAEVASESDAERSQSHSPAEITPEQMHKYKWIQYAMHWKWLCDTIHYYLYTPK